MSLGESWKESENRVEISKLMINITESEYRVREMLLASWSFLLFKHLLCCALLFPQDCRGFNPCAVCAVAQRTIEPGQCSWQDLLGFSKLLVIKPYFNFLLNLLSSKNYFAYQKKNHQVHGLLWLWHHQRWRTCTRMMFLHPNPCICLFHTALLFACFLASLTPEL